MLVADIVRMGWRCMDKYEWVLQFIKDALTIGTYSELLPYTIALNRMVMDGELDAYVT